jgi:hypothetical protein
MVAEFTTCLAVVGLFCCSVANRARPPRAIRANFFHAGRVLSGASIVGAKRPKHRCDLHHLHCSAHE